MRRIRLPALLVLLAARDAGALVVERAKLSVDPAHTDTVTLAGRFESLPFASLETLQIVLDGFAYDVPVEQLKHKKNSFKYMGAKGKAGVRRLSVDLKKRRFKVALAEIVLGIPGSPLEAQIVSNEGSECAIVPLFENVRVPKAGASLEDERRRKRKLKLAKVPVGTSSACAVVGPEFAPYPLLVGDPGAIVARIGIDGIVDAGSTRLFLADPVGLPTGDPLCSLADDGRGGDAFAADGEFACTLEVDTSVPSRTFVVASASVGGAVVRSRRARLEVLAPLGDADAQTIADVQAYAMTVWDEKKTAFGDGERARLETVAALRIDPRVESVRLAEPLGSIGIVYASGARGGLGLTPRFSVPDPPASAQIHSSTVLGGTAAAVVPPDDAIVVGNQRVLIWDPGFFDAEGGSEAPLLRQTFEQSTCPRFQVTTLLQQAATLDALSTLPSYGTVALVTHGSMVVDARDESQIVRDANGRRVSGVASYTRHTNMLTKEPATPARLRARADAIQRGLLEVSGAELAIRPAFVRNLSGAFTDTLLWGGYCYSGYGDATRTVGVASDVPGPIDSLAEAYVAKGVRGFFGYTKLVTSEWSHELASTVFSKLLPDPGTTTAIFESIDPKFDVRRIPSIGGSNPQLQVAHVVLLPAAGKPLVYLKPKITPKDPTVDPAGQVNLEVSVEGAGACTLEYRWRNTATVGHLGGGDDTTSAQATRTYTATSATKGSDTITVDVIDGAAVPKRTLFTLTTTIARACAACGDSLVLAADGRASGVCTLAEVCCQDLEDNDGDGAVDCDDSDCADDPDCASERIVYSLCPGALAQSTTHAMRPDGSDQQRIGVGGSLVRISPDGTRLATITGLQTVSTSRLDGSDRRDITLPDEDIVNDGVAWSPDGTQLVISVQGQGANPGLQLQTSPDRTGTTDAFWHVGGGEAVDWKGANWLFSNAYEGPLGYLNGIASAPAFSEAKVDVFNPYSTPGFSAAGAPRYRPDGTPSWTGILNGVQGLIVDGVLWLASPDFALVAYSPDGLWVANAYAHGGSEGIGGIAVFKFDGSVAYNAIQGVGLKPCGIDWGTAVGLPPVP